MVAIGWWLIAAGFLTGAGIGMLIQEDGWLGGYDHRRRRLVRLGHIALVALGALNVVWPLTAAARTSLAPTIGLCFLTGGLTMAPVCFLTAWDWRCRALFVVPASVLVLGVKLAGWGSLP